MKTKWVVLFLESWREGDSWTVNNVFRLGLEVEFADNAEEREIVKALRKVYKFSRSFQARYLAFQFHEFSIYIEDARKTALDVWGFSVFGEPIIELRKAED